MFKNVLQVVAGYMIWRRLKLIEHINYKKIVLVLTGENEKIDEYALIHLDDVMKRTYAESALILSTEQARLDKINAYSFSHCIKTRLITNRQLNLIFKWYCLDSYFVNLIFTYTQTPKDNLLDKYMQETEVNTEDAVCLGLYKLRRVPSNEQTGGVNHV